LKATFRSPITTDPLGSTVMRSTLPVCPDRASNSFSSALVHHATGICENAISAFATPKCRGPAIRSGTSSNHRSSSGPSRGQTIRRANSIPYQLLARLSDRFPFAPLSTTRKGDQSDHRSRFASFLRACSPAGMHGLNTAPGLADRALFAPHTAFYGHTDRRSDSSRGHDPSETSISAQPFTRPFRRSVSETPLRGHRSRSTPSILCQAGHRSPFGFGLPSSLCGEDLRSKPVARF
jgi:hypothetical protein